MRSIGFTRLNALRNITNGLPVLDCPNLNQIGGNPP